MRRAQAKKSFKIWLLALVLTLALVWYSLNPLPTPIIRRKRDDELPDEKKRNLEPHSMPSALPFAFRSTGKIAVSSLSSDENEDDFVWPEFING
jgi:hypothetical protein